MKRDAMNRRDPLVELDEPYSSDGATPTSWSVAYADIDKAEVYWVSTVRPDGRPHVTPVAAVAMDGSLYFSTGPDERKARNLARNSRCVVATGCNAFREGLDVIIEGDAVKVSDESKLRPLATAFATKYGGHFGFTVRDGRFHHEQGGVADVYEVAPAKGFAYGRGKEFSATRYRF
jgi:nitroimidazol reductase NimA-like FMN-containing flavoprotein (pyridoxamine 5'-phosphate oxidase superfamily)